MSFHFTTYPDSVRFRHTERTWESGFARQKALLLMSCGKSAKVSGAYDRTLEQLKKAGVEVPNLPRSWKIP
ncbi:MAG: hypothetical protein ACLR7Z_09430 [Bilophila wadsworthia]